MTPAAMQRSRVVVVLASLFGTWGAPRPTLSALGPRYGGGVVVGIPALPATTDPEASPGTGRALVGTLVHEPLVGVGADGIPRPALVEAWSVGAEGREWSLRLREGARFHYDRPVTAEDAVRSVRRFLRAGTPAAVRFAASLDGGQEFLAGATDALPGAATDGPLRVLLRFTEKRALPLAPAASPAAAITSPAGAGAGPFIPATRTIGRRLALTAFGAHVRGRAYLDGVELVPVPETGSPQAEVQAGRLDLAAGGPGVSALAATLLLVLDPASSPFADAAARAAVAGAIDRAELVRHLVPGGDPVPSLVVPALLPPLAAAPPPARVALAGALALAVDRAVPPSVSRRVVAHLSAMGLNVAVQPLASAAARRARTPARLLLFTPEVPEAGLALREVAALTSAPDAEAALDAADREPNLDRRRAHLHRAEQALRASSCLVPLATVPVSFAVRPDVHGATVDLAGRLRLEDAWREP